MFTFAEIGEEIASQTRRSWSEAIHSEAIRRRINICLDEASRFGTMYHRMADATLSLGSPGVTGTKLIAVPDDFGQIEDDGVRSSAQTLPLVRSSHGEILDSDANWSSNSSPKHWGILGRSFYFYPKISAAFVNNGGVITITYTQMMKHVASDGVAVSGAYPTGKYGDADYPDFPPEYHDALIDGATARELDARLGPGSGDGARSRWAQALIKLTSRPSVIGGGGPYVRMMRRNLVGSRMA